MSKPVPLLLKVLLIPAIVILIVTALTVFKPQKDQVSTQSVSTGSQIRVMASFYPLYYFAGQLGIPFVEVENLTTFGSEPHDYEPTPQQLVKIENSQLLLINGQGFEPWAERLISQLEGVTIVSTTEQIQDSKTDPHVWLSPRLAQTQVSAIAQGLISIDPAHQTQYREREYLLKLELQKLDQEFYTGLSNCQQNQIVTSHAAFGQLAQNYGFEQVSIAGLSPDEEPASQTLAQLSQLIKDKQIKYIFFETLVSPKLAQTLAQETGAETLVLDPLEGLSQNQIEAGENYFSVMRQNLASLRLALQCQ